MMLDPRAAPNSLKLNECLLCKGLNDRKLQRPPAGRPRVSDLDAAAALR